MKLKKWMQFFFECETKLLFCMLAIFMAGMVWGAASVFSSDVQAVYTDFTSIIGNCGLGEVFFKNYIFILVAFALGFSAIGVPFICFVLLFDGVCLGIFMERVTMGFGFKGTLIAAAAFFIVVLIKFISLAVMSFSSVRLSLALFNVFHDNTRYVSPKYYSKPHIVKFIFFSFITAINAFISALSVKLMIIVFA